MPRSLHHIPVLCSAALVLAGCPAEQPEEPVEPTQEAPADDEIEPERDVSTDVEAGDEQITDQDGKILVTVDELPDDVQPGPDTAFGGPTHFTNAVLSGDGTWLAIGSAGVAHGYGWVYDIPSEEPHLVAFQFGGSVDAHSWSPDGRFALFTIGTPAATDLLKIVDRDDIQPYARDTGFVVDVGEEPDPPFTYEPTGWQAPHTLCFTYTQNPYCVDASTGEPEPV